MGESIEERRHPVGVLAFFYYGFGKLTDERRRRGLDRGEPLSAPFGSRCKRVPSGVRAVSLRLQTMMLNLLLGADPTVSRHFTVYNNLWQFYCWSYCYFHKKDLLFRQLWYYHKITKLEVLFASGILLLYVL